MVRVPEWSVGASKGSGSTVGLDPSYRWAWIPTRW